MASIYKPRDSRFYHGRVQRDGRDRRKSLRTSNRKVALRRLDEWIEELDRLSWGGKPRVSFDTMMLHFMNHYLPDNMTRRGAERYMTSIRTMTPYFKGVYLDELTRDRLMAFEIDRRKTVSPTTIIRDLGCLSSAIEEIVALKDLPFVNPVKPYLHWRRKRGLKVRPPRTRYLASKEEKKLLDASDPLLADMIAFAIDTGLRKTEQYTLTWNNVDLQRREIKVTAESAKGQRERRVPLLPRAYDVLKRMPRRLHPKAQDWVFTKPDGTRFMSRLDALHGAAERAKIDDLIWHDLRRTCGCRRLQDDGLSMERVSKWLGHTSIATTERIYAFLEVDDLHRAVGTETGIDGDEEETA